MWTTHGVSTHEGTVKGMIIYAPRHFIHVVITEWSILKIYLENA